MARLTKIKLTKVERTTAAKAIDRIIDGDVNQPIALKFNDERTLWVKLEQLRLKLRDNRDAEAAKEEQLRSEIASVAHDLKTPLAIISGYAECAMDGMTDKDYLGLIRARSDEMNDLIINFVDSMRNLATRAEVKPSRIETRSFFKVEVEQYRIQAKNKKIKLKVKQAPKAELYGVKSDLSRIFQNILSNAIKYTKENGKIRVSFHKGKRFFYFEVKDSGKGIAKEDLPYIFERFYMADKSRSDHSSSGIGLNIVKELVDNAGGKITVKSKLGKGSRFRIYLPLDVDFEQPSLLTLGAKFACFFFFGWALTSIARFIRFSRSGKTSTLIGGFVLIPFFLFGWIADLLSLACAGKLTLLMD